MSDKVNYSFVDHDSIYSECVQYRPSTCELIVQCDPLLFTGFMSAGLIPITALCFILFIITRLIKLITLPKLYANQKLFGFYYFLTDLLIFTIIGFLFLFCIRGLAWLGLRGYYFHNQSHLGCRIMKFLIALANIAPANILFFTVLNAWLSTLLPGYNSSKTSIQLIFICFILTVVYALPEICVNRLWLFDEQYYCSTNPKYSRLVLFHAELHRILYGYGFVQASLTLICLSKLTSFNSKLSQTRYYLFRIVSLRNTTLGIIRQICHFLYQIELVLKLIIVHSFLLSVLILIRVFTQIWISIELYQRVNQSPRIQAHFRLYSFWASRDHLSWAIMILSCYHLWFYRWYFPNLDRITLNPTQRPKYVLGLNPKVTLNHWNQVLSVLDKMDPHPSVESIKNKVRQCKTQLESNYRF